MEIASPDAWGALAELAALETALGTAEAEEQSWLRRHTARLERALAALERASESDAADPAVSEAERVLRNAIRACQAREAACGAVAAALTAE